MTYTVMKISKSDWLADFAKAAFENVFGVPRDPNVDRIDFTLAVFGDFIPGGFITCIEMDSKTLYWQWGGAFIEHQGSYHIANVFKAFIEWSLLRYELVLMRVENANIKMLHLAMKYGFRIVGTFVLDGSVLVDLALKRGS